MSKEIETKECNFCESIYKLSYDLNNTSGHPKFCPFCGEEAYDDEEKFDEEDDTE